MTNQNENPGEGHGTQGQPGNGQSGQARSSETPSTQSQARLDPSGQGQGGADESLGGRGGIDPDDAERMQDERRVASGGSESASTSTDGIAGQSGTRQQGGGSQGQGMGDDNR